MLEITKPEAAAPENGQEVFGKFIPLTPDAKGIMDEYDKIREKSREAIVAQLQRQSLTPEASYYQKDIKAFIFKLDLIKQYIEQAGEKSNYFVVINASDNQTPTAVLALTKSNDDKNFTIVPNIDGQVPEHPGKNGNVVMGPDNFHGPKEVILQLE